MKKAAKEKLNDLGYFQTDCNYGVCYDSEENDAGFIIGDEEVDFYGPGDVDKRVVVAVAELIKEMEEDNGI